MENLFAKYCNREYGSFVLPIYDNTPQAFTHKFKDGRVMSVYIKYNKCLNNWLMDIYQQQGEDYILICSNIVLNYGLDLFSHLKYKDIGEFYVFPYSPKEYDSPEYNNLNNKFWYIWRH